MESVQSLNPEVAFACACVGSPLTSIRGDLENHIEGLEGTRVLIEPSAVDDLLLKHAAEGRQPIFTIKPFPDLVLAARAFLEREGKPFDCREPDIDGLLRALIACGGRDGEALFSALWWFGHSSLASLGGAVIGEDDRSNFMRALELGIISTRWDLPGSLATEGLYIQTMAQALIAELLQHSRVYAGPGGRFLLIHANGRDAHHVEAVAAKLSQDPRAAEDEEVVFEALARLDDKSSIKKHRQSLTLLGNAWGMREADIGEWWRREGIDAGISDDSLRVTVAKEKRELHVRSRPRGRPRTKM